MIRMDKDFRQRKLETRYRAVLSAAGAAQAQYFPLTDEPNTTAAAIERAISPATRARWVEQLFEARAEWYALH